VAPAVARVVSSDTSSLPDAAAAPEEAEVRAAMELQKATLLAQLSHIDEVLKRNAKGSAGALAAETALPRQSSAPNLAAGESPAMPQPQHTSPLHGAHGDPLRSAALAAATTAPAAPAAATLQPQQTPQQYPLAANGLAPRGAPLSGLGGRLSGSVSSDGLGSGPRRTSESGERAAPAEHTSAEEKEKARKSTLEQALHKQLVDLSLSNGPRPSTSASRDAGMASMKAPKEGGLGASGRHDPHALRNLPAAAAATLLHDPLGSLGGSGAPAPPPAGL